MSQQVRVERELNFAGQAALQGNVEGDMLEIRKHFADNFTGDALETNRWAATTNGSGSTIAASEVAGGSILITTGTVDNDSEMVSSAIIFNADKKAVCEVRLTITDVSGTAVFVGFSDAKSEGNNSIAIHYLDDVLTTDATDAVGFVIDADHATSSVMCAGVKLNADKTPVDTGIDWADGQTKNLRIVLDVDGNAWFYVDGVGKGYLASAVTDSTLLCLTIQAMTRANDGANTVRVRRADAWCDET